MTRKQPQRATAERLPPVVAARVEAEARRQVVRAGLDDDTAVELVQDVLAAVLAPAPFDSARAAQRYAAVAATHLIADAKRRQAIPPPVSLDDTDEHLLPYAADDPAEQASLRVGFAAMLAGLDPPLSDADRQVLAYPITPAVERSKREQDRVALRLHRIRRRLADEVRSLLAPVAVPVGRWWQGLGTEPLVGCASIAAAAAMGVILGANVPSGALPGAPPPAPTAASAATAAPASAATTATARPAAHPSTDPSSASSGPAISAPGPAPQPTTPISTRAGVARGPDTAVGGASATVNVGWWGTNAASATVYCDTPVRRAVCAAVSDTPGDG